MEELRTFGRRLRELRCWRRLTLREAAGLAGLSFSFWGQVERGEKPVTRRDTLETMADALRVHPADLTGQPWTPQDPVDADTKAGLDAIETALERYALGVDPEVLLRPWPQITADLHRLITSMTWTADYRGASELAPVVLGELHGAYLRLPRHRHEVLVGLIRAYTSAMITATRLGARGLPGAAVRAAQQCAETLDDPLWLGYAAFVRGFATGRLNRAAHYRRSVAAAENLTNLLDSSDALQACGMLHLSAAFAAGAQADRDTVNTHLAEASVLAARMDTEVGSWADLFFGPTNVGIWRTSIASELGEDSRVLEAAKTTHPELLPSHNLQAEFWTEVGRALAAENKTRNKAVGVLVHAEQLAPQRIRHDVLVREVVADLLLQARDDASGRELRRLAWRMGIAPIR
jgi:transcriptional regulator with XRE-family HTH domain